MTTLIAYQHEDFCLIAADSQTTGYDMANDCSPMGKIAVNGPYLVSGAGLLRGINIIQNSFIPPKPPKSNLDKFMVRSFVPALRKCFIESGYDIRTDGMSASHDNDFIVAVNGTLYFIDEAYGIERVSDKLYCTGTGMKLALGVAYALDITECDDYEEAIEILEKAVQTAIKFDVNSGGKIQIALQTKDGKSHLAYLD